MTDIIEKIDFNRIWPGFAPSNIKVHNTEGDLDCLAVAVRDMFMAWRNSKGGNAPRDVATQTPPDVDNLQLKLAENHYLVKAFAENSMPDLQQFAVMRRARGRIIGDALIREMQAETRLGLHEFCRLIELNQKSRADFVDAAAAHMTTLRKPEELLNDNKMATATGCVLCLALTQLGFKFDHNTQRPLFEAIDFGKTPLELILFPD